MPRDDSEDGMSHRPRERNAGWELGRLRREQLLRIHKQDPGLSAPLVAERMGVNEAQVRAWSKALGLRWAEGRHWMSDMPAP